METRADTPAESAIESPFSWWNAVPYVLSAVALLGVFWPILILFAPLGAAISAVVARIKSQPRQQLRRPSASGFWLSGIITVFVFAWHVIAFYSEAPLGVVRLDFQQYDLLENYEGQRICLKGYAHPFEQVTVSRFALLPYDDGGARGKHIGIELKPPATWAYSRHALAVTGILERNPDRNTNFNPPEWLLRDSEVRSAYSPFQLSPSWP